MIEATHNIQRAIARAFSGTDLEPRPLPDGTVETFCNEFVRRVLLALLLSPDPLLQPLRAAQQIDELRERSSRVVTAQTAQGIANAGGVVIAGWKNPSPTETNSGHVAIVCPSIVPLQTSAKWGGRICPWVTSVGEEMNLCVPANWAFGAEPTYYQVKQP